MSLRVLGTGSAGFVGSAPCRRLVAIGCRVFDVEALTYVGNLASLSSTAAHAHYTFCRQDICEVEAIKESFAKFQPKVVVHLAAESHVVRSILGAKAFIETNIVGTFATLDAARGYWQGLAEPASSSFRFLRVSTDEVYGSLGDTGLFSETTPYDRSSPYSASKAAAGHLLSAWLRTHGFPAVISNCSNNYEPFHFPEKLIPLVILNALHGETLQVYGRGHNIRDWPFVDDHFKSLFLIVTSGRLGETYSVGGRNERRNIDVDTAICTTLDRLRPQSQPYASLITYVTDRPGYDYRYAIDATRLEQELGWRAQESFEAGIEKTIRWYLDNA